MGKTKDLFKKIRDTKGTFHAKMGQRSLVARVHGIAKSWHDLVTNSKNYRDLLLFIYSEIFKYLPQ